MKQEENKPNATIVEDGGRMKSISDSVIGIDFNNPYTLITTDDKVVQAVCKDLNQRSLVGQKKYGTTLERKDLGLRDWLQHAYEECLDQANYLKRAIIEIDKNKALKRIKKERLIDLVWTRKDHSLYVVTEYMLTNGNIIKYEITTSQNRPYRFCELHIVRDGQRNHIMGGVSINKLKKIAQQDLAKKIFLMEIKTVDTDNKDTYRWNLLTPDECFYKAKDDAEN